MAARGRSREVCDKTARDYKFWPRGRKGGVVFKLAEPAELTGRARRRAKLAAKCESIEPGPS